MFGRERPGRRGSGLMTGLNAALLRNALAALAVTALIAGQAARAEDAPPAAPEQAAPGAPRTGSAGNRAASPPGSSATAEQHKLPADSTTTHKLELPGRTLSFTASVG